MISLVLSVLEDVTVNEQDVVTPFEQNLLVGLVFVIMFGLGAGLTPRDFRLAIRRPWGLIIGFVTQFGIMPLLAYLLVIVFLFQLPREYAGPVALGALLMGCVPAGTTSNIFTYFSKGNLALSVLMTVNSTVVGVIAIPLLLFFYLGLMQALGINLVVPRENIILTLILLLVPVAIGMAIRRWNANVGAMVELFGSLLAVVFILILLVSWVPRNWQFLMGTHWSVYFGAIGLGVFGFAFGYLFAAALKLHPRNARTIALETGIQNGPLAIAIVALTFTGSLAVMQQAVMVIPALYSLFIVITSTMITFWFRSANEAAEQKMPDSLL